jgi:hypothetical protein
MKYLLQLLFPLTFFLIISLTAHQANAMAIGDGAFSPAAGFESFEGLIISKNVEITSIYAPYYFVPGVNSPYTFASGVTMTAPIPNANAADVILVGDFNLGSATWGLGDANVLSSSDVPFGNAYLGDQTTNSFIELELPSDMLRVGIYATNTVITGAISSSIQMDVYDSSKNFLESLVLPGVNVANWGTNFLGIENAGGIRYIHLSGATSIVLTPDVNVPIYDGLRFEAAPVPEPSTLFLVGAGLAGIGLLRRRFTN